MTFRERDSYRHGSRVLLDRRRLTGQQRLVDRQPLGADDARVGRHTISFADDHEVARNELRSRQRSLLSLPDDVGRELADPAQRKQRSLGAGLLNEAEDRVEHDDRRDDSALEPLADAGRHESRGQQQARRAGPRTVALRSGGTRAAVAEQVTFGPIVREPSGGFGLGEPGSGIGVECSGYELCSTGVRRELMRRRRTHRARRNRAHRRHLRQNGGRRCHSRRPLANPASTISSITPANAIVWSIAAASMHGGCRSRASFAIGRATHRRCGEAAVRHPTRRRANPQWSALGHVAR